MELKNITPSTLAAVTTLLQPHCPDLSPTTLVKALKSYQATATTTEANNAISRPMTRKEVAELIGCSLQSVNRYMNDGKLQRIVLSPKSVRIDRQSVLDFLSGATHQTAGQN